MSTIHSSPVHFKSPATIGTINQVLTLIDNVGTSAWQNTANENFNFDNVQFVASNGNDSNSGTSFNSPKATLAAALANITNEGLIWILDSFFYTANLTFTFNVSLYAPTASLLGTYNVTNNSHLQFIAEYALDATLIVDSGSILTLDVISDSGCTITALAGSIVLGRLGETYYGDTEFVDNVTVDQLLTAGGYTYPNGGSTTPGYVMTATGPNSIGFSAPAIAGFSSINVQTFNPGGSYTYTPTTGMSYCIVECVGSGGGGGGVTSGSGVSAAAGGGGGGAYAKSVLSAATVGASQTITVGSGGAGGAAGNNNGSNGAASSFGSLVSADGGSGGFGSATSATTPAFGIYGAGGGSGTGQLIKNGDSGLLGLSWGTGQIGIGGQGGNSFYGIGGEQLVNLPGANGFNYGSGGGGAASGNTGAVAGGNGADGIVIVTEYIV